jgi:3'-5' exonuclease
MNRRIYFFDLESIPPPQELRPLLKPELIRKLQTRSFQRRTARYIDDSSDKGNEAEKDFTECTDEQFRLLSLHAEYGRVLTIGIIVEEGDRILQHGVLGRDRSSGQFHLDEARTLRGFWNLLRDFNTGRDLIIGHNILDFDLPFLYKRSRINRVRPTVFFNFARYRSSPIYDTMREWAHWNPQAIHISLAHLAEILQVGIGKTEGMDGSRVYDELLAGRHELIAEYCLQDVELTRAIYYRMNFLDKLESR